MFAITAAFLLTLEVAANPLRILPAKAGSHTSESLAGAAQPGLNPVPGVSTEAVEQNQAGQPARRTRPPDTDETVAVTKGTRLSVNNHAGEVQIRSWDRDSVRVQAFHSNRSRINVKPIPGGLTVTSTGTPMSVDYDITVPAWMPVKIEGTYVHVAVEGTQADVAAETVRGDISIKGGSSSVVAKSVEGEVILEGVRGRVNASSINQGVTVNGATGELTVETVNGHIVLNNIDASNVEVASVNGNIKFDGTAAANGRYRFSTHNGNISLGVPENASATFMVRTYNGSVRTDLELQGGGEVRRGERTTFTLGSGSAEFELESFGGTIQLRPRASDGPLKPRSKEKDED